MPSARATGIEPRVRASEVARDRTVSLKKVVPLCHMDGKNHVCNFGELPIQQTAHV